MLVASIVVWLLSGRRPEEFREEWDSPADHLTQLEVSPDGEILVTSATNGDVIVWDTYTGKPKVLEQFTVLPIAALAISHDGFVAAADIQRNLAGWQLSESQPTILPKLPSPAADIAFAQTRSGTLIVAVALSDGSLAFVDPQGVQTNKSPHQGGIKRLQFSSDGRVLVTAGTDGKLVWWDSRSRVPQGLIEAHQCAISAIELSDDGRWLATADGNGRVRIWNAETRKPKIEMQQPDGVSAIAWSDDRFVTGGWDGVIRFWSIHNDVPDYEIATGRAIHDLGFTKDHSKLATVSDEDSIQWWTVPPR